jgi:eukaryotic-like serine/threonine-protein kinase
LTDAPLSPGAPFGNYEVVAEIGEGGMGRVYKARDTLLDRPVALKVLSLALSKDEAFVQRFTREARVAARLNHPNIVQIYSFGREVETWFLAMELIDGNSIGGFMRQGAVFDEKDAVTIARHAARALRVAHQAGIVHRDVKPENLMMSMRGEVKLVDLGLAKSVEDDSSLTHTGLTMGTPHYIAPEQVRAQKDIDGRADIYSLGATLYHMASGRTPFMADSPSLVILKHLTDEPLDPRVYRPDLSENVCRVIAKMMAKDREARYQDMYAVDKDLERLQKGLEPLLGAKSDSIPLSSASTLPAGAKMETTSRTSTLAPALQTGGTDPQLRVYEKELARYIGPMAKVLVRRTSKIAANYEDLIQRLAKELPSEADRNAFLHAVRRTE